MDTRAKDLRDLIDHQTEGPVLSVFCRTDPRVPSNKGENPGWRIALRNGLKALVAGASGNGTNQEVVRGLADKAERRLEGISAAERARSVALFLSADGSLDQLIHFQIPFRADHVALDTGAVVWPMVDVIDRGSRTGLVLLSHDRIRLLEWQDGIASDKEISTWDLELGDWREYRSAARPNPQRGRQAVTHNAAYDDRVDEWRVRFFKAAAKAVAEGTKELDFERLVIAAEGDYGKEFTAALPDETRRLVRVSVPLNLIDLSAAEAAARLDPHLRSAWREALSQIGELAVNRVAASDRAAAGADEVLLALREGRVDHLLLDPYVELDDDSLSDGARQAIQDAGEATAAEALVELAIRTDARVSSAALDEVPSLDVGNGVLALLRY